MSSCFTAARLAASSLPGTTSQVAVLVRGAAEAVLSKRDVSAAEGALGLAFVVG